MRLNGRVALLQGSDQELGVRVLVEVDCENGGPFHAVAMVETCDDHFAGDSETISDGTEISEGISR